MDLTTGLYFGNYFKHPTEDRILRYSGTYYNKKEAFIIFVDQEEGVGASFSINEAKDFELIGVTTEYLTELGKLHESDFKHLFEKTPKERLDFLISNDFISF